LTALGGKTFSSFQPQSGDSSNNLGRQPKAHQKITTQQKP
jgi:hypothetical protein